MSLSNKQIDLSIVIPALNEEHRIGASLDKLAAFLKEHTYMKNLSCEVIVVCAEGIDNTVSATERYKKKFNHFKILLPGKRIGKGRDVKFGMLEARGDHVVYMDADLATPLLYIPKFHKIALSGAHVVVATRNLKKHHSHLPRRALSMTGNLAYRILGGVWIEDSQCGFKMFSKEAVDICFGKQTILGWGFDMELLTIAKVNGINAEYVRIDDWRDVPGGTFDPKKIFQHAFETLIELACIAKNRITNQYK